MTARLAKPRAIAKHCLRAVFTVWLRRVLTLAIVCCGVCVAGGCGRSGPELVPVEGTVRLDGESLAYKSLLFIPEEGTVGNGAGGYTDGEGNYSLIAVVFGATEDFDGCPPGRYRAVISEPTIPISEADFVSSNETADSDEPEVAVGPANATVRREVPAVYTSPQTTPLIVDVPEAGGTIDLELRSDAP